ncbi:MBL fold metallo-hydrolase [[Mycobacterium] wendilense]|uniref:MBL fold metallo-hydrolase n=1 Tax=[Mycobacterium] wendilense TaxID=3064284 RepID=A0ABN9P527_9MYCO|nr:MBL fold metallo-hydrolase [Mycolicibacterium sp. MU0050]CAJ1585666.1 MBL fold metallo-hydrolase [Mycolicibacterium sp. MU0050]
MTATLEIGAVSITRVMEWEGLFAPATELIPDSDDRFWDGERELLAPDHWDPASGLVRACLQTFVLRSEGRTILVDTGAGNHKERPYLPVFGHLSTDFLGNLAAAGVQPEDVDVVVNTHVHVDHVGWNTVLQDREWVPTFPNARYVFSKSDFDFWNPLNGHERHGALVNQNMFEDSVLPIQQAGLADMWEGDTHRLDSNLTLELAPGHTPGLSVLKLESEGERAVFVGDLLHSPAQILHPDWNSCFCEDPRLARESRRRVLSWTADNNALLVPAHLGGQHAVEIERCGDEFTLKDWAAFT